MLTPNEQQRIFSEVNAAFEKVNQRIDELQEKVNKLETPKKQCKAKTCA